jgi:tetraacyldisaccharide 4'-kinase
VRKQAALLPLTLAALIYRGLVALRRRAYHKGIFSSRKLSVPVISVGNLTTGGTGKTPFTIYLARVLTNQAQKVAVLSRGYRGSARQPVNVVSDGSRILLDPHAAGDEPYLTAEKLPGVVVLTGRDRARLGEYAAKHFFVTALLLDDGFQHLAIRRDLNVVLLNGRNPLGNGHLLPRGSLREPPEYLRQADIIVFVNRGGQEISPHAAKLVRTYNRSAPVFCASYVPTGLRDLYSNEELPLSYLQEKKTVALAGIAHPEAFQALLAGLGAHLVGNAFYPDHHHYQVCDLSAEDRESVIVTTEKDAVKLRLLPFTKRRVLVLAIDLRLKNEEGFIAIIKNCLPSR